VHRREIMLAELPSVNYVSVQDQESRRNAFEIGKKFGSMTCIGAEVKVGYYCYINRSFLHE